jgi:hypothetical protein
MDSARFAPADAGYSRQEGGVAAMHTDHEVLRSAGQRARRIKKTWGRMLLSAFGFAMAYYLDPQNGEPRRRRLVESLENVAGQFRPTPVPGGDAPPFLRPLRRALHVEERREPARSERAQVVTPLS